MSSFKGLEITTNIRNVQGGLTTRRAALGAADLERPAGETPPPPRRDVPCAGCAWQEFIVCAVRLSSGLFGLFGNSWDFIWEGFGGLQAAFRGFLRVLESHWKFIEFYGLAGRLQI